MTGRQLSHRTAPNRWCINEIIGHLADDEIATAWRYRQMIENDGAILAAFNQDEWVRLGRYVDRPPASESLELFRRLRDLNVRMLRSLTSEEWDRGGMHSERGRISVRELAEHMAGHDVNHILQIQKILDDQGRERPVPVTSP